MTSTTWTTCPKCSQSVEALAERDRLKDENARLLEDAERWRWFVRHRVIWRSTKCLQYGGEAEALEHGGPGHHELKMRSMNAWADEMRRE